MNKSLTSGVAIRAQDDILLRRLGYDPTRPAYVAPAPVFGPPRPRAGCPSKSKKAQAMWALLSELQDLIDEHERPEDGCLGDMVDSYILEEWVDRKKDELK